MKDKSIARVYAQSFIELGEQKSIDIAQEVTRLIEVINSSNQLENVLFLDIFTEQEKLSVLESLIEKLKISNLLLECLKYLINEKRIGLFPIIYKEIMVLDDDKKGFLRASIQGAGDEISEADQNKLLSGFTKYIGGKKPILTYQKNEMITAGYKLTIDDLQLDASIDNQLKQFKEMIIGK